MKPGRFINPAAGEFCRPGRLATLVAPGFDGVMVRSIGRVVGAVVVGGGAEYVREPRLPPPRPRASAKSAAKNTNATAMALSARRKR
jgi:hypothetical protein